MVKYEDNEGKATKELMEIFLMIVFCNGPPWRATHTDARAKSKKFTGRNNWNQLCGTGSSPPRFLIVRWGHFSPIPNSFHISFKQKRKASRLCTFALRYCKLLLQWVLRGSTVGQSVSYLQSSRKPMT